MKNTLCLGQIKPGSIFIESVTQLLTILGADLQLLNGAEENDIICIHLKFINYVVREIIGVLQERCWPKNWALRNSSFIDMLHERSQTILRAIGNIFVVH